MWNMKQHEILLVQGWNGTTILENWSDLPHLNISYYPAFPLLSIYLTEKYTYVSKTHTRRWIEAQNWKQPMTIKSRINKFWCTYGMKYSRAMKINELQLHHICSQNGYYKIQIICYYLYKGQQHKLEERGIKSVISFLRS